MDNKITIGIIAVLVLAIALIINFDFKSMGEGGVKIEEMINGNMKIKSAFSNNEKIPEKYTCNGKDINPKIEIIGIPEKTKSLVLFIDDPDSPSGVWDHWVLFNIHPSISRIDENSVPIGAMQGRNSWGNNEYGGPCPGSGAHRYFFKLYALDAKIDLKEGARRSEVEKAMRGHILERAELIGLYGKEESESNSTAKNMS